MTYQASATPVEEDEDGHTALHWAAEKRYWEIVKILLDAKASVAMAGAASLLRMCYGVTLVDLFKNSMVPE